MIELRILAVAAVRPIPVNAEDFDAGKSAPQLFASNCSSCHRTGAKRVVLLRDNQKPALSDN